MNTGCSRTTATEAAAIDVQTAGEIEHHGTQEDEQKKRDKRCAPFAEQPQDEGNESSR
jgi:hypothetical protein